MRSIFLTIGLFVAIFSHSQNLPECDSVVINCCVYNTYNPNTVDIEVSNYSSNIFPYPGFILFDQNMDTIAKETVNYYGIGWDQIHSMTIVEPFDLPFEGILELHTGFYYTHVCTFPITIPDTALTNISSREIDNLYVYPNPADKLLTIEIQDVFLVEFLQIRNMNGIVVKELDIQHAQIVDISHLPKGVYFVLLYDKNGNMHKARFIKK